VFARARENARRASCQSNLKQIGLGIMQYTQDYDERYLSAFGTGAGQNNTAWTTTIQPYLKSTQIFMCPSGPQTVAPSSPNGTDGMWQVATPTWTANAQGHYAYNSNFMDLSQAEVKTPAETALSFDCMRIDASAILPTPPDAILDASRHFDGINVLYADGHVKFYKSRRNPFGLNFAP
jgi:prepilin-type processing-associated H-X9-DG protein